MSRIDGRSPHQLRPVRFEVGYSTFSEGSALVEFGQTRVLCNATIEESVPRWFADSDRAGGWITAEYAMLPRATQQRSPRETRGPRGRTQEIQRLIGRSLRQAVNLELLGERTVIVDCDVLQADGGTRTAAITGGYVALLKALNPLIQEGRFSSEVLRAPVAAVSVGICDGVPLVDLCYEEDVTADVDANVVMNGAGELIEFQGTGENKTFTRRELTALLDLAEGGVQELICLQQDAVAETTS